APAVSWYAAGTMRETERPAGRGFQVSWNPVARGAEPSRPEESDASIRSRRRAMPMKPSHRGLKFGIFLAPFHRVGDNPTLAMARDMELIEWLDHLGYDEAWIGEHHSAGWEIIASPEIFIGAAVE